jgi:serine/threonine protein kinase
VEPFYGETEEELVEDNTRANVDFPKKYWGSISSDAKDLVQRMLRADPGDRLSAKEALQHPWLASKIDNKMSKCGRESEGSFAGVPPEEGVCSIM